LSSTNRGNLRDLHIADYYITPMKDIENFLLEYQGNFLNPHEIILDPAAGGIINKETMSYPVVIKNLYDINCRTIDIRKDSCADIIGDYLNIKLDYKPTLIITNPPFSLAIDFVKKALNDVADNGRVIMLLRLNFLESKERKKFFDENMPEFIYVHHKRMSFTGKGTDSVAYAHFIWRKNYNPEFSLIKVI
jgi:hypothetical protein